MCTELLAPVRAHGHGQRLPVEQPVHLRTCARSCWPLSEHTDMGSACQSNSRSTCAHAALGLCCHSSWWACVLGQRLQVRQPVHPCTRTKRCCPLSEHADVALGSACQSNSPSTCAHARRPGRLVAVSAGEQWLRWASWFQLVAVAGAAARLCGHPGGPAVWLVATAVAAGHG